jgi:hypothetical protein
MIHDAVKHMVELDMPISVVASSGKYICAEQGGPAVDGQEFVFTARSVNGIWETFIFKKGFR